MESNNSKYFCTDLEKEFREICKQEEYKDINSLNNKEDNQNIILLEPEEKKPDDKGNADTFLNKKRKPKKQYIAEIKRLIKEAGLEGKYIFTKIKGKNCPWNYPNSNSFQTKDQSPFNQINYDNIQINTTILYNNDNNKNKNSSNNNGSSNNNNNNAKKKKKEEEFPEVNPNKHTQQTSSILEWLQKLNIQPLDEDISNKLDINKINLLNDNIYNISYNIVSQKSIYEEGCNGVVKFNGILRQTKGYKHFIYLRTQNEFDPSINGKVYQWKVRILSDSNLIGVGLADKNLVLANKNNFIKDENTLSNGVFGLISTYNKKLNKKDIRPWHSDNKNLVNYVATFPEFKKGREITIIYNSSIQNLEFLSKNISYKMEKVIPMYSKGDSMLTPCAIFYYADDKVQFSELNIFK